MFPDQLVLVLVTVTAIVAALDTVGCADFRTYLESRFGPGPAKKPAKPDPPGWGPLVPPARPEGTRGFRMTTRRWFAAVALLAASFAAARATSVVAAPGRGIAVTTGLPMRWAAGGAWTPTSGAFLSLTRTEPPFTLFVSPRGVSCSRPAGVWGRAWWPAPARVKGSGCSL